MMEERLQWRIYGDASLPTLIYLPGLHGDWTLIGGFREALKGRVRFVEFTYPRTLEWSLDDYARAIEEALLSENIREGWVLAESFGSQIAWPLAVRSGFRTLALVLAGGFVRHPTLWGVRLVDKLAGGLSLQVIAMMLMGYATVARRWIRRTSQPPDYLKEFIARRTDLDLKAARHRLRLIANTDHCALVRGLRVPVYGLTGLIDPVVPWFWVRRWLRKNCPSLRDYRVVRGSDHTVLNTATRESAECIVRWMMESLRAPRGSDRLASSL